MRRSLKIIVPLLVLAVCVLGAATLVATRPSVDARPPARPAPLVRVMEVLPETVQLRVETNGTVAPRTESDVIPEVSGRIVEVSDSLVSGGFFEEGEFLLRIDSRDYRVALDRARAAVERTHSENERAKKELGRVKQLASRSAASEAQLDDATNRSNVTAAALREARASLDQAQSDLGRTVVKAPYAGRVRSESVDVGQFVNRGTPIARIYAIDYAEVRLPVADDELEFLDLPLWFRNEQHDAQGPEVVLRANFAGDEHTWTGRVVRTEGEIDARSRMIHVVARVDDPYGQEGDGQRPPLAVGLFVNAEILGRRAENVTVVPRASLRGTDRVLVVDAEDRLRIRSADVVRTTRDSAVLRSGFEPGDRVVVSAIATAVDGMLVRTVESEDEHGASS